MFVRCDAMTYVIYGGDKEQNSRCYMKEDDEY